MTRTPPIRRCWILALPVFTLLAACAEQTAEAPAQAPAGSQPAAQTATTPEPGASRLQLAGCRQQPGDRVHFRVGESRLAVPQAAIRNISPVDARPNATAEQITAQIVNKLKNGSGCPEKPMDANIVVVQSAVTNPLLAGRIAILRRPSAKAIEGFAKLTRQLQDKRPENNCRPASADLIACFGTEQARNGTTNVMYLVTTDPKQNLSTGGPLAARCVLQDRKVVRCGVLDVLPGGIAIDATLKGGKYSTGSLRDARNAAMQQVNQLKL